MTSAHKDMTLEKFTDSIKGIVVKGNNLKESYLEGTLKARGINMSMTRDGKIGRVKVKMVYRK